jgi:hypothetical protein
MFSSSPGRDRADQRLRFLVERGPENRVFVDSGHLADLGEGELRCAVLVFVRKPIAPFRRRRSTIVRQASGAISGPATVRLASLPRKALQFGMGLFSALRYPDLCLIS